MPALPEIGTTLPQWHGWHTVWSQLGSEVRAVHTGCPQWPPQIPSFGCCVCVPPHPRSSPGPGKSQGHTDTDLSSATLLLILDFMGAREGEGLGRCAQLGPPEFQPELIGALLFHWLRRRRLQRGRGAISPWHRDTKMSPVTVKYKDGALDRWFPNEVEMQGQGNCNSQTSIPLCPFPTLHCLFSGRPVEKCFEKNETNQLNSIAMHDDSIVSLISLSHFVLGHLFQYWID